MDPYFLGAFFAIIWLSASLFAADLLTQRETELRLARVPANVR
jgi:hypothetical protein